MATAFIAGAATPLGQALIGALSTQGVACIAHVHADSSEQKSWQQKFLHKRVRVDFSPWLQRALFDQMRDMKPTHVFLALAATPERLMILQAQGVKKQNYEETNFKYSNMIIDAVVTTGIASHIVYVRPAGAVGAYAEAMDRAEQKIKISGLPYTIVHAPPVDETMGNRKLIALRAGRKVLDAMWWTTGLIGLRELKARKMSIAAHRLARRVVDQAIGSSDAHLTLQPHDFY